MVVPAASPRGNPPVWGVREVPPRAVDPSASPAEGWPHLNQRRQRAEPMPYRFKRDESTKGVWRIGRKTVRRARHALASYEGVGSIHDVRKEIKKLRALIRLLAEARPRSEVRRIKAALRRAARKLGPPRDALVNEQTFARLQRYFRRSADAAAVRRLQSGLRAACAAAMREFDDAAEAGAIAKLLWRAQRAIDRLSVHGEWGNVMRDGLARSYRKGRRAYQTARADPAAANFHAWRKRAKDLALQLRLLSRGLGAAGPSAAKRVRALCGDLDALVEILGSDHDLEILWETLAPRVGETMQARLLAHAGEIVGRRQRTLRARALRIGSRRFADAPKIFCRKFAAEG